MIKKIEDFLKLRKFRKIEPESTGYDSKRIDRLIASGFKLEDNYLSKFNKKLNGYLKIKKEDNRLVIYSTMKGVMI